MNLAKKVIAETIGTFALVFAGCGSIMVAERFSGTIETQSIPIIFGLVVSVMIYALGHISGAHFNPAVTLAFVVARHFPKQEMLAYWFAQFAGGIVAMTLLYLLLPEGFSYGATVTSLPLAQAFFWEVILSFFLMFVIIAVATDTRAVGIMAGAAIGGTVAFCAFLGGPVTGASMNPARSLAPALFQGTLSSLWIYLLAPPIGTVLAAKLYEWIRCEARDSKQSAKGCC